MGIEGLRFPPAELPPETENLRAEVRAFLAEERASGGFEPHCDAWMSNWSPEFSRKLAARGWIGTPYIHQASLRGVGCDCLGLVRGVWAEVTGSMTEDPGAYAPDWAERSGAERLLEAARLHCGDPVPLPEAMAGDIVLFRWRDGVPTKHAGILSGPETCKNPTVIAGMERPPDGFCPPGGWFVRRFPGETGGE